MVVFADGAAVGKAQLDILRNELEDARGEISSLIGQIEGVREDLTNGERRGISIRSVCCCCSRRDLRRLEDRLWLRLHQLQEKENELHRQRTAILSRPIPGAFGTSGDPRSPVPRHHPPPVSPEAPASPPWRQTEQQQQQQQQRTPPLPERRQLAPSSSAASENQNQNQNQTQNHSHSHNHNQVPLPASRIVSEAGGGAAPAVPQRSAQPPRPRQPVPVPVPVPVPATRPLSLRRRPSRPGSAEDTGSGAE